MRKTLFLFLVALLPVALFAQASDLFISEYIEGSSNNKALEIFNGTGSPVDLSVYEVWIISNGGNWAEKTISLSGTVNDGDVYVVANSSADAAILNEADLTTGSASWNGDDAVGLAKNGTLIDEVGEEGADPGTGWDVAGVTNATANHTLIRKSDITSGSTDWAASAGTNADNSQWIVHDQDYFTDLGQHTFNPSNNTTVQFASSAASVNEGDGTYDLVVTISNPDATNATTADVVLISGDPADLGNYTTQTVTFPAGSSDNQIVTITITDDSELEGDEDFTFELQNVSGGNSATTGSPSQFVLTVIDNETPAVPDIVINEIMQNPNAVADSDGEWFELYNNDSQAVDINGWTIKDDGSDSHLIDNGGPLTIDPGDYLVLGINGDQATNGGVVVDYVYSGFTLANGADEVVLIYSDGTTEVDRVNYDGGTTFPDPTGASMELKNPGMDNNAGANWGEALSPYGDGDLGSPGAQNSIFVSVIEDNPVLSSDSYQIFPNYPNPFNPSTTIRISVPQQTADVQVLIYDVTGKKIRTLFNGTINKGAHEFKWNGFNDFGSMVSTGVYFALLKTKNASKSVKMMLLR